MGHAACEIEGRLLMEPSCSWPGADRAISTTCAGSYRHAWTNKAPHELPNCLVLSLSDLGRATSARRYAEEVLHK